MDRLSNALPIAVAAVSFVALLLACGAARAEVDGRATAFGGQLVRSTTLSGAFAIEVGGGGALYATERLYWGGGGGTVFPIGSDDGDADVELVHAQLALGYDLVQSPAVLVSAMALAGAAFTKPYDGVFGIGEARLAVRRPLSAWFMLGGHVAYRRVFASDMPAVSDGDLSGPIVGLELYFTH
jgi:hypothetical protein